MSKSGHSNCGSTIMRRLFIRNDRIKNVFHHNILIGGLLETNCQESHNVQEHYADIVQFLQYVISHLDYPSMITEKCHEIGLKHRKYKAMGMKTEHWDLLGEAITETIREYQGWKRHRESLRAANILVSFLVDRIRNGFLQRDVATPIGTPPPKRVQPSDRGRSRSLQDADNGGMYRNWTDSCPSINDTTSVHLVERRLSALTQKRSVPAMSSSRNIRQEMQIRRRRLPETPLFSGDDTDDGHAIERRRQYRHSATHSFELGQLSKR
ncbi:globin [Cooperia oncophora]